MYLLKDEPTQEQICRPVGVDWAAVISGAVQLGAGLITIVLGYQQLSKRHRR